MVKGEGGRDRDPTAGGIERKLFLLFFSTIISFLILSYLCLHVSSKTLAIDKYTCLEPLDSRKSAPYSLQPFGMVLSQIILSSSNPCRRSSYNLISNQSGKLALLPSILNCQSSISLHPCGIFKKEHLL